MFRILLSRSIQRKRTLCAAGSLRYVQSTSAQRRDYRSTSEGIQQEMSDLEIVDGMDLCDRYPQLCFRGATPNACELAGHILCDAVLRGTRCIVGLIDDWWVLAGDKDWLLTEKRTIVKLFSRVVPAPELG